MLSIPELNDVDVAFPTAPPLPAWDDIPEDFRKNWHSDSHPWCGITGKLFFTGGTLSDFGLTSKDGVDSDKAHRAIRACLGSFAPKYEHKIAGVAFMLSEWFDKAEDAA